MNVAPRTSLKPSRGMTLKTGDLYQVNLDPTLGDEIKKTRPVVVLNPGHEKNLRLAIVVPVTAWKALWESNPFFLTIDPKPHHGLRKKSAVDCFRLVILWYSIILGLNFSISLLRRPPAFER